VPQQFHIPEVAAVASELLVHEPGCLPAFDVVWQQLAGSSRSLVVGIEEAVGTVSRYQFDWRHH